MNKAPSRWWLCAPLLLYLLSMLLPTMELRGEEAAPGWVAFYFSFATLPELLAESPRRMLTDSLAPSILLGAFANVAFLIGLPLLLFNQRFRATRGCGAGLAVAGFLSVLPIGFFCRDMLLAHPGYWVWAGSFGFLALLHAAPAYRGVWRAARSERVAVEAGRAVALAAPFALVLAPLAAFLGSGLEVSPFLVVPASVAATGSVSLLCLVVAFGLRLRSSQVGRVTVRAGWASR